MLPHNLILLFLNQLKLVPEFCFPLIFEIWPKSGFYRLPTHRRDAHIGIFLDNPFLFLKSKFDNPFLFLKSY